MILTQETVAMMKFAEEDFENTDEDTGDDDEEEMSDWLLWTRWQW